MGSTNPFPHSTQIVTVNRADRWEVYRRLQELDIACDCKTDRPLQIEIYSPTAAIQLWSIVKSFCAPRHELLRWLDRCWQMESNIQE